MSQRDRHDRGLRGPLIPARLPGARSRAAQFDATVLDVVEVLTPRWPGPLRAVEIAVDDVPRTESPELLNASDAVLDGPVQLTRYFAPGVDRRGEPMKARVVLYRRPIELRCGERSHLAVLISTILIEQFTALFGEGDSQ